MNEVKNNAKVTIQLLEGLIKSQKCIIVNRENAIKENGIRISRMQSIVEKDSNLIHNSVKTIEILEHTIKGYKEN